MPRKIDVITELYKKTIKELTSSPQSWKAFLETAAFQYKYDFRDQVLIYAQRPKATACAEFEMWNETFGRRIKAGSHGIALISDKKGYTGLRHVFDVKDTYNPLNRGFRLWSVRDGAESEVIASLENRFGSLESKDSYTTAVRSAVNNICEDNYTDYLNDLRYSADGSYLDELDDDNLLMRFYPLLETSVAYTVLTRLGYKAEMYLDNTIFDGVYEFNTPATVNLLGTATGDIAEICLYEIERTARAYERSKARTFDAENEKEYNHAESNKSEKGVEQNERDRDELQTGDHQTEEAVGGGRADDRSAVSESDSARAGATASREVRDDETGLSEEAPKGDVHDAFDRGEAGRSLAEDRGGRKEADLREYIPNGDEPWGDGGTEGDRSDEVGADDERDQSIGGGRSSEQSDLRISEGSEKVLSGDDMIAILRHGDYLTKSKTEIVSFLMSEDDDAKKTAFIHNCYPKMTIGFYRPGNKEMLGYSGLFEDGLHLYEGTFMNPKSSAVFSWKLTRELIEALIKDGNYLNAPKEGEQLRLVDMEMPEVVAPEPMPEIPRLAVAQSVIDTFLRLGGCTRESTSRIYGYYRRANDVAENVAFLRSEYESDNVGLILDGLKYAAAWDENGMTITRGDRVKGAGNTVFLSWEDVDRRIRQLLEMGQYIPQDEAEKSAEIYENFVANKIADLYRDRFSEIPPIYKTQGRFLWPEITEFYKDILTTPGKLEPFISEVSDNIERAKENPRVRRFYYGEELLYCLISQFRRDPIDFPQAEIEILPPKHFVTQDKIERALIGGSNMSEGKFRIYSYFLMHKDNKKRADFLKNEYGWGGSYGSRIENNSDGKGLAIGGDLINKSDMVLLTWTDVAKRIDTLIRNDKYMNEAEIAHLDDYEKEQLAYSIQHFFDSKPLETPRPYGKTEGFFESKAKEIVPQLASPERVAEIIQMMQSVFDSEMPSSHRYEYDKKALETVKKFADGKYDLFPHSHFRKKASIVPSPVVAEQEPEEPKVDIDLSDTGYDLSLGTWVHIGKDEMQIESISDDTVALFDGSLFPVELTLEQFLARVKENPLNDHLKLPEKEELLENEKAREIKTIMDFCRATKQDDFDVYYNDQNEFCAKDDERQYTRRELYEFLLNEVVMLDQNEKLVPGFGVSDEIISDMVMYAKDAVATLELKGETAFERAKRLIDAFILEEYNQDGADYSDMTNIGIAYTTTEDDKYEVQVNVDLVNYRLEKIVGGVKVEEEVYPSLDELCKNQLEALDFDNLTYCSEEEIAKADEGQAIAPPTLKKEDKPKQRTISVFHPEIPMSERLDFDLTANEVSEAGKKERFRRNIMAIQLLKTCENENRLATAEEQKILSQYAGFGGIPEAFDESNDAWHTEYLELSTVLTPDEYTAARESTLTAFYTPPVVIQAMYQALGNMGFAQGNILEPSCGVGNFIGNLPDRMKGSKVYGVELDNISGRITRQLYQRQNISICGFEETVFPDSFFDVAVGNVPFGQFKVTDKKYDKHNFLIHDYFFAKAIDKVRPGGVIAFITSKGTLDKENPSVRKYIAQRADLIGAIRLPDNAFKGAGTEVVSDIIFLQKRDRILDVEPDWVHLGKDENGITVNQYFIDNPDMILGDVVMRSGPFGQEPTVRAYEGQDLGELLTEAISNIHAEIKTVETDELEEENGSIPADPTVKNFSYTLVDGKVYFRQNSVMNLVETSVTGENRIKGMIALRETVRALIDAQLSDESDEVVTALQSKLNEQYDTFTKKYGLINSRANETVFSDDSSYFLLSSLEVVNEDKELIRKADMFVKRTIKPYTKIDRVDTASEALAVSLSERAAVDMEFMSELTGKSEEELFADLHGVIFLNPKESVLARQPKYLTADEYLSGNVREKLADARKAKEAFGEQYAENIAALEAVQPQDLTAAEIGVKLGSTWVPDEVVQEFVFGLLDTPKWAQWNIGVKYIPTTAQWIVTNKSYDRGNVKASTVYGTGRINAYSIIEETLNLKDVRIFDYVEDENGNKKPVLNKKETTIAQGKQEQIKRAFEEWIWKDATRREKLCALYNERFNSVRPREYDGSHIKYYGMNPEIHLRDHQTNAVARILYGGNSLLAHVVGAGKTYTMVAAAQESKRLGLCAKSMFVVPNHLVEQWASEYLQLYPSANILVTTKKDFETKNRKKFCARIATGDYDAIIIGHSQFEKIPMSLERQKYFLQSEIDELTHAIADLKYQRGERVTIKQLEKSRKQIQTRLDKLNDQSRKDDVVCFEELGVDRLFVDEAHFYKNLFSYTKMRNVAGIAQTEAQKSSDLYMKCRYLSELTGNRGVVFATGTPISNSMVELYTMQRYLQYDELKARGLSSFDAWASTFGETVTAIELSPTGDGYRAKTRFAKFFNIPELMSMFKQVADVQTADMLNLPVPKANYHVVKVPATETQKAMVQSFAERAEKIHNRMVNASVDNMLCVTNDGRKAALDQRLMNATLPDEEGSKVNTCVQNIYDTWERTADNRSAQLVFCDLSTPKGDGTFNVYDDIRDKLLERGVPKEEIAFIHTADTDAKKKELFAKVRSGQVRVLIGSTFKMGAGTNVQTKLVALHDLDCPWRPSDLEQRSGRIIRQGNENDEVDISRYVTEGTFDAYMYQLLESKQKFISQIMTSKSPVRSAEDVDETALSYAEIKALASGNPKIMEKMQLDADVAKLKLQKASHLSQRYMLEDKLMKDFPRKIAETEERIAGYAADMATASEHTQPNDKGFSPMVIGDKSYYEKADAGKAILEICKKITSPDARPLGEYRGFKTEIGFDVLSREFFINLRGKLCHTVQLGQDANGIITRLDNAITALETKKQVCEERLRNLHLQVENAKAEIAAPFPDEAVLEEKSKRLDVLNAELNMDKKENELADDAPEQEGEGEKESTEPEEQKHRSGREER